MKKYLYYFLEYGTLIILVLNEMKITFPGWQVIPIIYMVISWICVGILILFFFTVKKIDPTKDLISKGVQQKDVDKFLSDANPFNFIRGIVINGAIIFFAWRLDASWSKSLALAEGCSWIASQIFTAMLKDIVRHVRLDQKEFADALYTSFVEADTQK
jgi:hypothetical protein